MRFALCMLALAGCVTQTVRSRPIDLAAHEAELVASASARVEVIEGGTAMVDANREVLVWIPNETTLEKKRCVKLPKIPWKPCVGKDRKVVDADEARHVSIRALVTGCAAGDCLAKRLRIDEPIEVGSRTYISGEAIARSIGAGAMMALATYCFVECENG